MECRGKWVDSSKNKQSEGPEELLYRKENTEWAEFFDCKGSPRVLIGTNERSTNTTGMNDPENLSPMGLIRAA